MGWLEDNERIRREAEAARDAEEALALGSMARAILGSRHSQELESIQSCQRAASEAVDAIRALAQGFAGLEGVFAKSARVRVGWDSDGKSLTGSARVERPGGGMVHERDFRAPPEGAPAAAERAALRALMESVSGFAEGLDVDMEDTEGCGSGPEVAFLKAARAAGGVAGRFAELCAEQAVWSAVRSSVEWRLEKMLALCAREGLVPREFEEARLHLDGGEPGRPTWLVRFDVKRRASFSGSFIDLLASRSELRVWGPPQEDHQRAWELPPLEAGFDAVWAALSKKVAVAQALGWVSLGRIVAPELGACEAKAEACELRGAVTEPARAPRRPGL